MTTYSFATIDPRAFRPEGRADNSAMWAKPSGQRVTVPVLADALTEGNIDPSTLGAT